MASFPPPLITVLLLTGALSGCFGGKNPDARCDDVAEYQLGGSLPAVVAPEGLEAPSRDAAYSVPVPVAPADAEAPLQARGAACLERPPAYFRNDPAVAPAKPAAPAQ